jgi:hypothetical protein
MPFARRSSYSFTAASIRQNAPAWGGIYGLSNAQDWIYIRAVDDIRAALLDHLNERNPTSDFRSVAGFSFELCDTAERFQRCSRLIQELRPVVRDGAQGL